MRVRARAFSLLVVALAAAVALFATGGAARAAGLVMLNAGTVELNRATISEEAPRSERPRSLERAVSFLRTAEGLDPGNPAIPRNLAMALAAQDDNRRARAAADRARADTAPTDGRGQFQLGRAYIAIGAWSEAIRAWDEAEAGPQLVQLAGRILRARNWDQAIAAYSAAARINPRSGGAYEGIARAARARGDTTEEIAAAFEPLIARGDLNEYFARLQIARVYREDGHPNEALEALGRAEQVHRDDEAIRERGILYVQLGRFGEAVPYLRTARLAFPDDPEPLYWQAVSRAGQGNHEGAVTAARAGLAKLEPRQTAERARFLAAIGDNLLLLGRPAEALAAYEQGLALRPDDSRLLGGAARARAG